METVSLPASTHDSIAAVAAAIGGAWQANRWRGADLDTRLDRPPTLRLTAEDDEVRLICFARDGTTEWMARFDEAVPLAVLVAAVESARSVER